MHSLEIGDPGALIRPSACTCPTIFWLHWHEIVWEIQPGSMRLLVDGELRFERAGEYGNIEAAWPE